MCTIKKVKTNSGVDALKRKSVKCRERKNDIVVLIDRPIPYHLNKEKSVDTTVQLGVVSDLGVFTPDDLSSCCNQTQL